MSQTAWLVVDMTVDFVAMNGVLTCGQRGQAIVGPLVKSLTRAHEQGDLIIFACDAHQPDDAEFRLWPPHCVKGTPGAMLYGAVGEFYDTYRSDSVLMVEKTHYDAFYDTNLDELLRSHSIEHIHIAGVCTSICCYATASGAYYRHYGLYLEPTLMADLTDKDHDYAIQHMKDVLKAQ